MKVIVATELVSLSNIYIYISGSLNLIHSLGSRTERERLEDGIVSEAKRMISFDFVIK